MFLKNDNSHSWVRLFHGLKMLVTNLNNSKQETSEVQFKEYALKLDARDFAASYKVIMEWKFELNLLTKTILTRGSEYLAMERGSADESFSKGFEPNDNFITEACVEFTQESVTEQRFLKTSITMTSPSDAPHCVPKTSRSL